MKRLFALLALALPVLAACDGAPKPPGDDGICYQYIQFKSGKHRFNAVSKNVPSLEKCAAELEAMRIRFLNLGGDQTEIVGAYQTQFLFLDPRGVSVAGRLDGARFPALVRTGDGHLAPPSAFRQP